MNLLEISPNRIRKFKDLNQIHNESPQQFMEKKATKFVN